MPIDIDAIHQQVAAVGKYLSQGRAEENAFVKRLDREHAERKRKVIQDAVNRMADASTPESRMAAAKARAAEVHSRIEEHAANADLQAAQDNPAGAFDSESRQEWLAARIDDFKTQFRLLHLQPDWLVERLKKINAKLQWKTRKGKRGYFNVAVHENNIPIDKMLTILANLYQIVDGKGDSLDGWVDAVVECGLFPRLKKGKFLYGRRCQDAEHCELCNYLNISSGLKTLLAAYDGSAFYRGGNSYAFTVAPRTNPTEAKAVGRTLTAEDWKRENPESAVFRESYRARAFVYPSTDSDESQDWELEHKIRCFLGATQFAFGGLVKDGWLDGIRAKVENSVEFLPYSSHQHWHGVGSSKFAHDAQRMAERLKEEVDAELARTCPGLYADVMVAVVQTPEDLQRWVKYINKTVDLPGAIESVYNRNPNLRRTDSAFQHLLRELEAYPGRSRRVYDMARHALHEEKGSHTYSLHRRYVRGNHEFGEGSILSESAAHRKHREENAERARERRLEQGRIRKPKSKPNREEE